MDGAGKFAGKVAVVTGAASGIGLAAARLLDAEGASVVLVDRNADTLEQASATLGSGGDRLLQLVGDVGSEAEVTRHAGAVIDRFSRIDILFTAAGWSSGTTVPDTSLEAWEGVLNTNLTGTFLWCRAAIPEMKKAGGGSIILVGSQLAFAGGRGNAAYLASKGAIASLARTMAVDHAPDGIRVNAVVPGAIDTPLLRHAFSRASDPEAARERSVSRHPLGRLGRAEEVARAVIFLASDEASFTTGSCLMVDGGWLAG